MELPYECQWYQDVDSRAQRSSNTEENFIIDCEKVIVAQEYSRCTHSTEIIAKSKVRMYGHVHSC